MALNFRPNKSHGVGIIGGVVLSGAVALAQFTYTSGWEGVRFKPYYPIPGDPLTVCIGHTGADITPGKIYTKAECLALFNADMAKVDAALEQCVHPPKPMTPDAVIALRDFAFNAGGAAACSSSMVRYLNAGDVAKSCDAYKLWMRAGNSYPYGLKVRRILGTTTQKSEQAMCRTNL
jgi:lysozyme